MIKITVEEIEILITAKIEDNLKQNIPKIKQMVEKIKQQFEKVDMSGFEKKTMYAVDKVNKKMSQLKGNNIDKTLQTQFQKAGASVEKYEKQLEQAKDKLKNVYAQMDERVENTWSSVMPDGLDRNNPKHASAIEPVVNSTLEKDSVYNRLITQEGQLNAKVEELSLKLQEAKQNYASIDAQIQQSQSKQNIFTKLLDKAKTALKAVKGQANGVKGAFSKLPSLTTKVNTKIKQMSKGMKTGLKHVLKYAGALFSLRGIYSVLSNSASAWLSSQNSQAKQLSANIDYMGYAMGSAFAPVIQYVTNLVYQLMKAIQSVVYALFKVNIFANASAKSYSNMADSASKASKETKSLAGFDEINNIGGSDSGSDSGSGTTSPNVDLSTIDTSMVSNLENIDFTSLGEKLGLKINEALGNINWEKIQSSAKNIATNISGFINGFIEKTDWSLVGSTIGNGLNTAIIFVDTLLTTTNFDNIGNSIATRLNSTISTIDWNLLGKTFSDGINSVINIAYGFVTTFDWKKFGVSISSSINGFFSNVDWTKAGQALSTGIQGILNSIISFISTLDWFSIGTSVGEFLCNIDWLGIIGQVIVIIAGAFGGVITAISGVFVQIGKNIWNWVYDNICKPVADTLSKLINKVKEIFNNIKTAISNVITKIKTAVVDKFNQIKDKIKSIFDKVKTTISTIFNNIKTKITTVVSNIYTNVKSKFTKVKDTAISIFNKLKSTVKSIFSGIWTNIKKVINSILGGIEGMANGVVNGINKVIQAMNRIKFTIPDWVPGMGGKSFGFNVKELQQVTIPKLATGNVATEETLAIFGEYSNAKSNPEITAPQSIIYDTMKQALDDSALSSNKGNGSMPKQIVIKFGSTRVAYEIEELIRKAQRQNGTATVTI